MLQILFERILMILNESSKYVCVHKSLNIEISYFIFLFGIKYLSFPLRHVEVQNLVFHWADKSEYTIIYFHI